MTSTSPTPSLLPGIPASTWARLTSITLYVMIPAYVGFGVLRLFAENQELFNRWFLPTAIYGGTFLVATLVFGAVLRWRSKRELAAGYTTLRRSNPTVPQLDPRTGQLLRKAGEPYLPRTRSHPGAIGEDSSSSSGNATRPSRWFALRSLWYLPLIGAFAVFGLFARSGWLTPAGVVWLPVAYAGFIAVIAIIFLFVGLNARRTLAQIRAAAPDEVVFVFSRSKAMWPALNAAGWTRGEVPLSTGLAVSASTQGFTVWQDGPATSGLTVPWSSVVSVQADAIPTGNQTRPGVLIALTVPNGEMVALPFANANSDTFPLVSKAGVDYLVGELKQLRTGKTSARLI
jgi:hypothetical protein